MFTVQKADIDKVAGHLPDWQDVASDLGFGEKDIDDIVAENRSAAEQRKAFVRKWINRDGQGATYEKLVKVLKKLGKRGPSEKISEIGSER